MLVLLEWLVRLSPILVIVIRFAVLWPYRRVFAHEIPPDQLRPDVRQTIIITFAGFSFSGLLAVAAVDAATPLDLHVPAYYLLGSFLCYLVTMNLQDWKSRKWHEQVDRGLSDAASISLVLAVVSTYVDVGHNSFGHVLLGIALGVWGVDYSLRLAIVRRRYVRWCHEEDSARAARAAAEKAARRSDGSASSHESSGKTASSAVGE
jgi:hypothetical protein